MVGLDRYCDVSMCRWSIMCGLGSFGGLKIVWVLRAALSGKGN